MANGDALLKRYEVRDPETGEMVEDAFVLRPRDDDVAQTAMMVYGGLCDINAEELRSFVREGVPTPDKTIYHIIRRWMKPPPKGSSGLSSASNPFDSPFEWAAEWAGTHPEVRAVHKHVMAASKAVGLEPIKVVYRAIPKEEEDYWTKVVQRLRRMKGLMFPRKEAA